MPRTEASDTHRLTEEAQERVSTCVCMCAFACSLVRHLNVGLLTAIRVDTLMSTVNVHAGLTVSALVCARLTLIYICIQETAMEPNDKIQFSDCFSAVSF